ncbi:MAG: nucleotide exchange factor GrpE [Planctomycetota bacterium]|nr:nucleotide exchange factor GrpE [Planctomycetota bacterium]
MSGRGHKKHRRPGEAEGRPPPATPESEEREAAAEPAGEGAAHGAPPGEPDAGAEQAPTEMLKARLAESERERQELVDRLQRLAADFSNFQKRMQRRLVEEKREAVGDLLCDLLPVLDNFERALVSSDEGGDAEAFREGVRMVHDQLLGALARHGVEPIEAAGRRFDPEHHEAVAHVPSDEHPSGHVIDEVQRGYRHGDRTLRASRVAVSRGPAGSEAADERAGDEALGDASRQRKQAVESEPPPRRDRKGAADEPP